jgi:hypothetical protein
MESAVERLTRLVDAANRYDIPPAELLPMQIEAARERLAMHGASIQFVKNRIEDTGVKRIGEPADLVPLLFAHTAYKSYPEGWLEKGRWSLVTQWLDTVSACRVEGINNDGVTGIDDWITRLADKGHFISCSSGTTGKVSMIPSSMADRLFTKRNLAASYEWATSLPARKEHQLFICHPSTNNFRFLDSWDALVAAYGQEGSEFRLPGEPITVGRVREMVRLRKSINEGAARPADIAAYERLVAEREQMMNGAVLGIAEALVATRGRKLMVVGMFALMFKVAEMVREMGFSGKHFHPDNLMMVSGGLKGAALPPDYRERIMDTFNIDPGHAYTMYGMQELNAFSPRCRAGRYHVPPWVLLLVLDQPGEQLVGPLEGEVEGRAGFFDVSHEQRWGGLISGDKIAVDYGKCACGHQGPTVADNIVRYSDLSGGDKISCAGTIDAYVRGAA